MRETIDISGVHQVAVVVHDIEAAVRVYSDRFGLGPWPVLTHDSPYLTGTRIRGKNTRYSMRIASVQVGSVAWELIQPLEGQSIYAEFLATRGEGMHHVLVRHSQAQYEVVLSAYAERGHPPLMEGTIAGKTGLVDFAYLDTADGLKTILEISKRSPDFVRRDPDYWYPSA